MSSLAKHVIHQPKPFRCTLIVITSVVITALLAWYYFEQTTSDMHTELTSLNQRNQQLETDNLQLSRTQQQLTDQLMTEQQSFAIKQATNQELQSQLNKLQDESVHLNKELMFYQTITQGNGSSKLQIRELHLFISDTQSDMVSYRTVITQGEKISKAITGTVEIMLNSNNNGINEQSTIGEHQLNLRHVQVFEGHIKVADYSQPKTVIITVKQNKKKPISKTFNWQIDTNSN